MGTRSVTTFIGKKGNKETPLVAIYQHYDGYIAGVGHDIARWLKTKKLVNGISFNDDLYLSANGTGCLAAQFIDRFKDGVGDLYITNLGHTEDYNYYITVDDTKIGDVDDAIVIAVTRFDDKTPIFVGTPSELLAFEKERD